MARLSFEVSLVLLMIELHQTGEWTILSLMRHYLPGFQIPSASLCPSGGLF